MTKNLRVGLPEVNLKKESKFQPGKPGGHESGKFGDGHDFNIKGKVTSNEGSDYHDTARSNSGLAGNFAEKDSGLSYLKDRNKKGPIVRHYSAGTMKSQIHKNG